MQSGMLGTKRNTIEILANMLKEAKTGITKTRLVYRTNMNFFVIRKHIDFLMEKDLLVYKDGPTSLYTTTEKGLEFLEEFGKIRETLGIEEEDIEYDLP